jgi:ABC-type Na+ efflux pump permease subunit
VKIFYTILAGGTGIFAVISYFFMAAAFPVFIGLVISEIIGFANIGWNVVLYPLYMFLGGLFMFFVLAIITMITVDQIDN